MEQYNHCVFVASNYTNNKRKGLHFLYNEQNVSEIMRVFEEYGQKEGVSVYFLKTDSVTISSLSKKDAFFKTMVISEGTDKNEFTKFFESINNQISSFDISLLFLTRDELAFDYLELLMFHFYCIYSISFDCFPFKEKLACEDNEVFFKQVRNEFKKNKKFTATSTLRCNKEEIIFSKFLNCDGGFEEMNRSLQIFYKLTSQSTASLISLRSLFIQRYNQKKKKISSLNFSKKIIRSFYLDENEKIPDFVLYDKIDSDHRLD